jgi:hypothetical protein
MRSKINIFLALVALVVPTSTQAFAMGDRNQNPQTAHMCDTRSKTMKFVLTSENGEVKETFKVPVRYMSAKFEREGRLNSSLHLAAILDTLEPRCYPNGEVSSKEESLQVILSINLRPAQEWESLVKKSYSDTDKYQFEEIGIDGYPDFIFKASNVRPAPKEEAIATYGYIPVYPSKGLNIPVYFRLECGLGMDMKTLNMCRMRFLYENNKSISATAVFHSSRLAQLEQIYSSSIKLINMFHVK